MQCLWGLSLACIFPGVAFAVEELCEWIQVWLQELQSLCSVPGEMVPLQCLAWLSFFFSKKGKNTSNSGVVFHWSNGSCLANLSSATHSSKENVFAACVLHWEQVLSQG